MRPFTFATIAICFLTSLTGCYDADKASVQPLEPLGQTVDAKQIPAASSAPTLYVLNLASQEATVSVYGSGGRTLLRSINLGKVDSNTTHVAFATDKRGNLYGSASDFGETVLTVYRDRGAKVKRTISQAFSFSGITFDQANNLYTLCASERVCEYASGTNHIKRKFSITSPPIAADAAGDVGMLHSLGGFFPWIYAPKQKQPYWEVTAGTDYTADGMLFDSMGYLYVSMRGSGVPDTGSVAVFAPRASSPTRDITDVLFPQGITIDGSGNLYVLNQCGSINQSGECTSPSDIAVYPPGKTLPSRVIAETRYVNTGPSYDGSPLALDSAGNLYVVDSNSVNIYPPGASSPSLTITNGITNPVAIAIGK